MKKSKIPNYPKTERGRQVYVRYPVQLTQSDLSKFPIKMKVGQWVAADVIPGGYSHLVSPHPFDNFEDCKKACDASNKLHGWSIEQANDIVSLSMEIKPEVKAINVKTKTPIK